MYNKISKQAAILLQSPELKAGLAALPHWKYANGALFRDFQLRDFESTWSVLNQIALRSHLWGHHPTITTTYNKVSLILTNHDLGGVTDIDMKMARRIEKYISEEL
ncbi:4a-hydroxytetrahydrobiopterin dehydratase Ecym_4592 [Eremothecium cymbalariae DBVPG|uniref:4a-hydroxytetrahydrobiopterin dehydratase n=1 Tax=Eremothecium cymbalariae (strain CBS 270.75 / DBVPG 7215 / KCTC 17166 / NRRL Y-17582) TaxID=931890 RepID=G8JSA2_ERECY|nr:hypothetical protein Ecym_4592 [Eremothecium cymbalariae DBVPG\